MRRNRSNLRSLEEKIAEKKLKKRGGDKLRVREEFWSLMTMDKRLEGSCLYVTTNCGSCSGYKGDNPAYY